MNSKNLFNLSSLTNSQSPPNLSKVSNQELHRKNFALAEEQRRLTLEVIHHLRETDSRRLYAELGYANLWEYVTQYLRYSEGSAGRRIRAMKLLSELPEIEEKIAEGTLSLTTVCQAQAFLKKENYTRGEKLDLVEQLENKSARDVERQLVKLNPEHIPKEEVREIADDKVELKLILTHAQIAKLDKLKNLRSHKNPSMSYNELIDDLLDLALKKLEPKVVTSKSVEPTSLKKLESKSQLDLQAEVKPKSQSRYIAKAVKAKVYERDQGQCAYLDPITNRRCTSRHLLQYDHRQPFAHGGANTVENLTLSCATHNQLRARQPFSEWQVG